MADRLEPRHSTAGSPTEGPACAAPDVDPDWFFPVDSFEEPHKPTREAINERRTRYAQRVCDGCSMVTACLEAGKDDPFGIYGGQRPRTRKAPRYKFDDVDVVAVERVARQRYGHEDTVLNLRESRAAQKMLTAARVPKLIIAERLGITDRTLRRRELTMASRPVFFDEGVALVPDREGAA